jgi:hypothetical protein
MGASSLHQYPKKCHFLYGHVMKYKSLGGAIWLWFLNVWFYMLLDTNKYIVSYFQEEVHIYGI